MGTRPRAVVQRLESAAAAGGSSAPGRGGVAGAGRGGVAGAGRLRLRASRSAPDDRGRIRNE